MLALSLAFRNCFVPFALFRVIVLPIVKYPEDDSGPRTGCPTASGADDDEQTVSVAAQHGDRATSYH